ELARTLEQIARSGPDLLYRGAIARAIGAEAAQHGGTLTEADLSGYRTRPAVIEEIRYGVSRIAAADRPAMGRTLLWRLRVLGRLPHYTEREEDLHAVAELLTAEPPPGPDGETDAAQAERLISGDSIAATAAAIADRVRSGTVGATGRRGDESDGATEA